MTYKKRAFCKLNENHAWQMSNLSDHKALLALTTENVHDSSNIIMCTPNLRTNIFSLGRLKK